MNRGRSKGGSFTSFTSLTSLTSFTSFHNRISFNFHQHFRRNQLAHFHHARRWPDLSEKFSMRPPHLFPLRDVGHIDARPHDVFQARAGFGKRRFDVLDGLHRLRAQIAYANDLSVWSRRRRSRNCNDVADPHRALPRTRHTTNQLPAPRGPPSSSAPRRPPPGAAPRPGLSATRSAFRQPPRGRQKNVLLPRTAALRPPLAVLGEDLAAVSGVRA